MYLYKVAENNQLTEVNENPFKKEIELQSLCEKNLDQIFGLSFVRTEFSINNFRIDTLAFNPESKCFVIIEYKKDKNFSVIDQGYAYLSLMLNNKADFILEYNENCSVNLKRTDIDWSQSKVIFVSPIFTTYQKESINFKDLPIELWEVKRFLNETIYFNQIKSSSATESIQTVSKINTAIEGVNKEIKVYTEEDHLKEIPEEIQELYSKVKESIFNLSDSIEIHPTKLYIGFVKNKKSITDVRLMKKSLKIWLNLKINELDDPKGIAKDVSSLGHWGNGDYEISIIDDENIEYISSLVKQVLRSKEK